MLSDKFIPKMLYDPDDAISGSIHRWRASAKTKCSLCDRGSSCPSGDFFLHKSSRLCSRFVCDRCFGVCLAHITLVLLAKEMWKCLFVRVRGLAA